MSLVTDHVLLALWEASERAPSDKHASVKLWLQLWNKHLFSEREWTVGQEPPLGTIDCRGVDIAIEYTGVDNSLIVLAFHEARPPNTGPREIHEAEEQGLDTCVKYLEQHPTMNFLYAFTSFGTRGKAWKYTRGGKDLEPFFGSEDFAERGSEYVELHSPEAQVITHAVRSMRAARPNV